MIFSKIGPFLVKNRAKITTGPTLEAPSDFSRARLGECDTPLEPYAWSGYGYDYGDMVMVMGIWL